MAINNFIDRIKIGNSEGEIAIGSSAYGECSTAAGTKAKTVDIPGFALNKGTTIHVKFIYANTASDPTLNVNNTGDIPLRQYGTTAMGGTASTTGWNNNAVLTLTYDGSGWIRDQGYNTNSTYTITSVWCNTAAATAAKTFSNANYYTANNKSYFEITFRYANSAQSALTLNGKTLYINGTASSASNYTIPAGKYLVYYDNNIYYIRTDGKITGDITGDAATVNGLTVETAVPANAIFTDTNKYHKSGSWNGLTYTATAVNGADELKFTIPNKIQTNWELNATSGNSPALLFTRDSTLTDWKIFVTSGKLSFQSATDGSTWTERAYFKDNSGDFVAASFTGKGSDLTNLNASNISSGTLNLARLGNQNANYVLVGPSSGSNAAPSFRALVAADIPDLSWNKITSDKPTTLSGYGITDAKIASGVITLGSNTITPVTSVNGHTGSSVNVTAGDLGLSSALRYQGTTTTVMSDGLTTAKVKINNADFTPSAGDVVIYNDAEYLWTGSLWELIGAESSFKKVQTAVNSSSASGNSATTFVSSVTQDTQGVITVKTSTLNTSGTWSGNAGTATNISSKTPTLAVATESNEIKIIDLGNNNPVNGAAQRHAIDFRWYDSHWAIGNIRSGSTPSAGFGFSYSSDSGTTYSNLVTISTSGKITATGGFSGNLTGNVSGTADAWTNDRTVYVNLENASTTTTINGGGANAEEIALGIDGTLGVSNGGTGVTTVDDIFATYGVEYIEGTQTGSKATNWTGNTKSTALYIGKTIAYKLPIAGNSSATLELTYPDGTKTGQYPVYAGSTRLTTHYPANSIMIMVWNGSEWRTNPYYNTDSVMRTYALATTTELPILAGSTNTAGAWADYTSSYKSLYGVITSTTANRATINPSTGHITAPGGITTSALHVGTADSYGDAYTPIYWNDGVPSKVTTILKENFTLGTSSMSAAATVTTTISNNTSAGSRVVQIVVTDGMSNLHSTIEWQINSSNQIQLSATTQKVVSGYILYIK